MAFLLQNDILDFNGNTGGARGSRNTCKASRHRSTPVVLVVFYDFEVAPPSILEVVPRQDQCRQGLCVLLRILTAVLVGAYLRPISLLHKPGACSHQKPRDWQRHLVVLRHTLSIAATLFVPLG